MNQHIKNYLNQNTAAATLAFFRLAFGFMMLFSLLRFAAYGWIDKFYIKPQFHFTYYGFSWVKPYGNFTYLLFVICIASAVLLAIGYKYRLAAVTFFMTFLPANAYFSVDSYKNTKIAFQRIPKWNIDIIKLLLAVVYFYAGL